MGRSSSQGLTASDFHHQPYVNPVDIFPGRLRLVNRTHGYKSPISTQTASRSPSRFPNDPQPHKFVCCGEEGGPSHRPAAALNCCIKYDGAATDSLDFPQSYNAVPNCCDELAPLHTSPSLMDCEDCVDDCDDCVEEHLKFNPRPTNHVDHCDECKDEQCDEGQPCKDTCDECDFSCFDCIDWSEFERDKSLGLSFSVPLLGDSGFNGVENGFIEADPQLDESDLLNFRASELSNTSSDVMAPPLDVPMHHQCFPSAIPYWNDFVQAQICTGIPQLAPQTRQYPLPPFGLEYGCHPATAHQQDPFSTFPATTASSLNFTPTPTPIQASPAPSRPESSALADTKDLLSAVLAPSTSLACRWLMPCGTVCGASFATGTDLKKHLKAVHLMKGVTKCSWQGCDSADFTSEAALTGHISKKHLAPLLASAAAAAASLSSSSNTNSHAGDPHHDQGGPFKCTYPGCTKSFMYKQVRDEHVASCHNGNKMHCHICGQYLNGEGSNFKRHMATHRPKHQHMICKFHGLGCKKRFPRLDNLRRHEACCKFGKKAGLVHVHGNATAVGERKHGHHHHHHLQNSNDTAMA
ncbi:hypothetical protein A1O3_06482 [Capronia epimyces CBS 606.96]|uniref:C2H2-type domain-containing protein n=1 Tax=Capronia epimyces CBS 606.96 TaxID=1182542 RepID=W9XR12_9EURO|nr:uncharacterized protein A1O3_06482 [Capronia epimyces CBS 606.96]EXJ82668.1 hypothetical protein A1O3_06482 [Capronia epimyces CBS 606.96]